MLKSCAHIDSPMHGNQAGVIADQSDDMLV